MIQAYMHKGKGEMGMGEGTLWGSVKNCQIKRLLNTGVACNNGKQLNIRFKNSLNTKTRQSPKSSWFILLR